MKKNSCFITGGSGLLGSNWLLHLKNKYHVFSSINNKKITFDDIISCEVDLLSKTELFNLLSKIKPLIFIHTAAISNVEKCEFEQNRALKTNVEITKNIIDVCSLIALFFVRNLNFHLLTHYYWGLHLTSNINFWKTLNYK